MTKIIILLSTLTIWTSTLYGQESVKSTFDNHIELDTTCRPDYYHVQITISEYAELRGKGRKRQVVRVSIDSVELLLKNHLKNLGHNHQIFKSKITKPAYDPYDRRDNSLLATFEFTVHTIDSVASMYRSMKLKWIRGIEVKPRLTKEHLNVVRRFMEEKLKVIAQAETETYAKYHGLEIDYPLRYRLNFNQTDRSFSSDHDKSYEINFKDLTYQAYLSYAYALK